ncbi:hypothetical protein EIN_061030 [Entamoeba invadens IP1]|uniref:hypothetical protein n=1 Tax=Entamoeba invadens IP1 TaxID=370355 RepID=UPI0002C3D4FB|nr:hypothetical protein EIN_061030 [Entamoeba invadens IP1]ELP93538.1 hypothetical protein EIN_061030 [Entamoeba invadens IP1]|eukprot:XP_004260309.1 hypothetical protein EIN_061030 [Entamoeba invadens IP1]
MRSSDFFEDSEPEFDSTKNSNGTDITEKFLFITWGIFFLLTIPSVVVFSIFLPTMKYPLDELKNTIVNNKTFDLAIQPSSIIFDGIFDFSCNSVEATSVIGANVKLQISASNAVLIKTHRFQTDGECYRSLGGTIKLNKKSICDPSKPESFLLFGYEDMDSESGQFIIGTKISEMTEDEKENLKDLIQVNSSYSVMNWECDSELMANQPLDWFDSFNNNSDVIKIQCNTMNQTFVVDDTNICFTAYLKGKEGTSILKCLTRIEVENVIYVRTPKEDGGYITMSYEEYNLMLSSDSRISANICKLGKTKEMKGN